jgi:hypothetical protein
LYFSAASSQTIVEYYGAAGEAYTSSSRGDSINLGYRMFTAPMSDELCINADVGTYFVSPRPVVLLYTGETFSIADLQIDAINANDVYIKNVPIVVGLPEIRDGFASYRPYDLSLTAVGPGSMQIEIMGYCNPEARTYLTLTVLKANAMTAQGLSITIPEDWQRQTQTDKNDDDTIILNNDGTGSELKIKHMIVQGTISADKLRALTNVPSSTNLARASWGGYSGFNHEYFENNRFYMHWWLASQNNLLLATYSSAYENKTEIEAVKKIIASVNGQTD